MTKVKKQNMKRTGIQREHFYTIIICKYTFANFNYFLQEYSKLNYIDIIVKASLDFKTSATNIQLKNEPAQVRTFTAFIHSLSMICSMLYQFDLICKP